MSVCNVLDQNGKVDMKFIPTIVKNEKGAVQFSTAICNAELNLQASGDEFVGYNAFTANVVTAISGAQFAIQKAGVAKLDIGVQFRNIQFTTYLSQQVNPNFPLITRVPLYIWAVGEVDFGYTLNNPYKTFLEFVNVTNIVDTSTVSYAVFNVNQTIEFTDYFTAKPETGYLGIQMTIGKPPFGITNNAADSYQYSNVQSVTSQGLAVKPLFPTNPLNFTFGLSLMNQ